MSVRSTNPTTKRSVPPGVIAIAVVLLVLFVGWRAYEAFAPIRSGPLPPPPTKDIEFIKQKAQEAQGDFAKLSPEDQQKVQQAAHGFGQAAIASAWNKLQRNPH